MKPIPLAKANAKDLKGQWIVTVGKTIVAHSKDFDTVFDAVKNKYRPRQLTFARVPY